MIFRSVSPRYVGTADIVSGYGSYRAGGRWNAPGIYAIYGSIEPGLAADESFNFLLQHFGWQNRDIPPRMVVGIRVYSVIRRWMWSSGKSPPDEFAIGHRRSQLSRAATAAFNPITIY
jgi:hypothetical protein